MSAYKVIVLVTLYVLVEELQIVEGNPWEWAGNPPAWPKWNFPTPKTTQKPNNGNWQWPWFWKTTTTAPPRRQPPSGNIVPGSGKGRPGQVQLGGYIIPWARGPEDFSKPDLNYDDYN